MKKNSLKKVFSALTLTAVAASMTAVSANALEYTGNTDVSGATVTPTISVTKEVITLDEAKATPGRAITITVSGGTDYKYASTGLHVYYDKRLSIDTNPATNQPNVKIGSAGADIESRKIQGDPTASEQDMSGFFVATASSVDTGVDGVLWQFTLTLPDDVQEGDVYPIDIIYKSTENAEDMFLDANRSNQLMMDYVFTQGINNLSNPIVVPAADIEKVPALAEIAPDMDGYIAIEGGTPEETTTEAPATTTTAAPTTTTTAAPATTTTAAPATTATTGAATTDTNTTDTNTTDTNTTDTNTTDTDTTDTSTSASSSSSSSSSSSNNNNSNNNNNNNSSGSNKSNTTTGNSPQTGVAGVGVAAAGLGIAVVTAFVLRRRDD